MTPEERRRLWYDFFYTELTTGLRRGEICGLKWEDFDSQSGSLKIQRTVTRQKGSGHSTGKTKTETGTRTIILPPSTAELLKNRKENAVGEWIFPNFCEPEKPMAPDKAYSHITDAIREQAAVKIDRSIGGTDAQLPRKLVGVAEKPPFEPYKPKIRKAGTGCISKLNEHLYEGRYSPRIDGKRISRNVYAKTREECEEKLAELIKQMKTELKI